MTTPERQFYLATTPTKHQGLSTLKAKARMHQYMLVYVPLFVIAIDLSYI